MSHFQLNKTSGLTFIEILFVVIIIGILISSSIPQLKKFYYNLLLNSSSRQLQSFMNYLRQHSIVTGEVIYLIIDQDNKLYLAQTKDGEIFFKVQRLPAEINIESEQEKIAFYPDGSIDKLSINLMNPNNQSVSLTTKGVFGGVKLQLQK